MPAQDQAIPILPSRSLPATLSFYRALGFDGDIIGDHYAIVERGTLELHFFLHTQLDPASSAFGCYLRVLDVDAIYRDFSRANLPAAGIPRIDSVQNKSWGMREFAIIDLDGSLLRIGQIID